MKSPIRWSAGGLFVSLVVLAAYLLLNVSEVAAVCEICTDAQTCGGNGSNFPYKVPGWMNLLQCTGKPAGTSCSYCDGTGNLRNCMGAEQNRHCTYPATPDTCGNKTTSVCVEAEMGYMYCKKSSGGTQACSVASSCNGDAANP